MPLLETHNLVMQFGGIRAVNDASIEVEPSRVAALIGPNGAGKTTTFNIISGLQEPTSGRIVFEGNDITKLPVHERARLGIARTFQRLEVFGSLSVHDNIRTALEIYRSWSGNKIPIRSRTVELMERVGVRDYANVPADSIPTGVARLTELGRALATDPRLLLLDEPSSGLDEEETDDFGELLLELAAEGKSVLMVEHDVELVFDYCEWVDVLDFGSIIARGPAAEIQKNPIVQAAYLGEATEDDLDAAAARVHEEELAHAGDIDSEGA
ncbi:MAG: ABC transporter ATP-binding protein [Nitriliruptorales bacterium]|nr:ABC transporter ATP-binding protein [Nitriliruptorales bacterium]